MEGFCETPQISIMVLKHIEINYLKNRNQKQSYNCTF